MSNYIFREILNGLLRIVKSEIEKVIKIHKFLWYFKFISKHRVELSQSKTQLNLELNSELNSGLNSQVNLRVELKVRLGLK